MQLLDVAINIDDMWGEELNSKPISEVPETIDISAELDAASTPTMNDVAGTAMNIPLELLWTFIIVLIALLLCIYFAIRYRRNHYTKS